MAHTGPDDHPEVTAIEKARASDRKKLELVGDPWCVYAVIMIGPKIQTRIHHHILTPGGRSKRRSPPLRRRTQSRLRQVVT